MASTLLPLNLERCSRSLIILSLAMGNLLQAIAPVLANGTPAGETIRNTATATYIDADSPNVPIITTSNTVTIVVAEVAGITVTASGTTFQPDGDRDGNGQVTAGDELYASYTVTNVGNDPTTFRIPNSATINGSASVVGNLEVSSDSGTTWLPISGPELMTASQPPDASILVRVPITVAAAAQTDQTIEVILGNTPANAQNQPRTPDAGDVYTVDGPDGSPADAEIDGAPVNGSREASASQRITLGNSLESYSLATLLKTRSGYDNRNSPATITDDRLTYALSLRVERNVPTTLQMTPAPLGGTALTLAPGPRIISPGNDYILISDAIPAGTNLASVAPAPDGWTAVYTLDPVTVDANAAVWSETAPADLADVTRVGFVYDSTTQGAIAIGEVISGFSITLAVADTAVSPLTVANIAQAFGASPSGAPVYDESGDQSPSNFGDSTSRDALPPGTQDTDGNGLPDPGSSLNPSSVEDGFIDRPTAPETGVDTDNNNSGDQTTPSAGGEANVFIVESSGNTGDGARDRNLISNGPVNAPEAIGPGGSNETDFTNQAVLLPAGITSGSLLDPAPVLFTNTVKNQSSTPADITLEPRAPTNLADLPSGTTVTLTAGGRSATYRWTGAAFTSSDLPITLVDIPANRSVNYGVAVDLPEGTPLSTDSDAADPGDPNASPVGGFPVPIIASIDTNDSPGPEASNVTIDRVYTGYLRLIKEARILQGQGPAVIAGEDRFSADPKSPASGNIIEYRITYRNITEPQSGVGNVILGADNLVIVENGTSGANNWALDRNADGVIDTSNVPGSARDSQNGTITFKPAGDRAGETAAGDVTEYVNRLAGSLGPQAFGEFRFQRQLN